MTDAVPADGQPALPPQPSPTAAPPPATPSAAPETPPAGLWDRMRDDPQYAPEHLALEAVRRLGPEAAQWAERVRAEQPGVSAEVLAESAVRKFVNHARLSGAVSGAAGLPGAVIDVGVLAWTQARMVLHVAAAYGVDPTHADRATDLLVLQKVHKAAQSARLALGVAAGRERAGALFGSGGQAPLGRVMLRLGVRLAQMAGVRAAKRVFAKVVPGAAIILGTWANSSATKDLAVRSRALYRQVGGGGLPEQRRG
ncbi:EcsC family protein [Micromonospora sp. NPDC126480]|uniref:EcsC family protein n=1 Tax=Micromonospora sp. NPDC126480 TaxID=3155312 RepID=UPI00331A3424